MSKPVFVIYDTEEPYAKKIFEYILAKAGDTELFLFTKIGPLNEFLSANRADILLAADLQKGEIVTDRVESAILLSDTPVDENASAVFKYSAADDLLRRVMSISAAGKAAGPDRKKGGITVIGIFSPVKRCFQTTFALTMGQIYARKKKTLYLSFEAFSGFDILEGTKMGNDLMDLLYFSECDTGNFAVRIDSMAERIGELDHIPPVRLYSKYRDISRDQWIRLLKRIRRETGYEVLILDLSEHIRGLFDILAECDRFYTIEAQDQSARAKLSQFEMILGETGYQGLKDKMIRIRIPTVNGMPEDPVMLPYTELAEYVKRMIDEQEQP